MVAPAALVEWLSREFDPLLSKRLDEACADALRAAGVTESMIADSLTTSFLATLLGHLRRRDPDLLPFDISDTRPIRLVGKERPRPGDTEKVEGIRPLLRLQEEMLDAVYNLGHEVFERICAAIMSVSGASRSVALTSQKEGGIDLYGRIPLRLHDQEVPADLLKTTLIRQDLFFLGQCKCIKPVSSIDRPELQKFAQQVRDCCDKYEGNPKPPPKRVPSSEYRKNETTLSLYFTTGIFTADAIGQAEASDIRLINGPHLAQLLIYNRVGVGPGGGGIRANSVCEWAESTAPAVESS